MIIIDYSQLIIGAALAFGSDFDKGKDAKKQIDILRHTIINTLLGDKAKFGNEFGDIVIACDGKNYWRRDVFAQYKSHRAKNRDDSKTDWKAIFDIGSQLREEFKEVLPYKFVQVDKCEADDIIAVLCKYLQDNELSTTGLLQEEPQPILIKSNDGDFGQLHKYRNVRQWNPMLKKYVKTKEKHFLLEKLLTGDAGDGIPNIRSSDNQLVEGVRQKPITAKLKEQAIAQVERGEEVYFGDKEMDTNYRRNRTLIDFDYIPDHIYNSIVDAYNSAQVVYDKSKIFNYFIANRCKNLMTRIQEF